MTGLSKFDAEIWDDLEGRFTITVTARDEEDAGEEAMIAAAEHGCRNVAEIVISEHFPPAQNLSPETASPSGFGG